MPKKSSSRSNSNALRDMLTYQLARQHADYLRTGNPIYAWRALQIALSKNRRGRRSAPVPGWVLDYLSNCAATLQHAKEPTAVALALGLGQPRGGATKKEQARTHDRNERLVDQIVDLINDGKTETAAMMAASSAHHVAHSTARNIYHGVKKRDALLSRKLLK